MASEFESMSKGELVDALRALHAGPNATPGSPADDRLRFLVAASDALGSSLDYSVTLARVAELAVPMLGDVCAVDVRQDDGKLLRVAISHRVSELDENENANQLVPPPLDDESPLARLLATGKPMVVSDRIMYLPLIGRRGVVGVMTIGMARSGRSFVGADLATASDLAARMASAIDSSHLYRDANQAIATREDILSFVSHDLKNPLLAMWLTTESMLGDTPAVERRRGWKHLQLIRRAIVEMRDTVESLLDWTSFDAGTFPIAPREQEIGDLLNEAAQMAAPMAAARRLAITVSLPTERCRVRCDPERTLRVLSNLLGNAVKVTREGGSVALSGRPDGTQAVVAIADTGPGIAPNLFPRLFDRHRRRKASPTLGHGLGLYISKAIVEAQGGRIWAENRPESGGSVFYFTLPLA
jgi:signal transduction histidine kinase